MKYITAFLVFVLLLLFDVLILVAIGTVIIGLFLTESRRLNDFPYSAGFARRIWQ